MAAYQKADPEAFKEFFARHKALLFNFLLARTGSRPDADEAFQETFLKLHRAILSYDPRQSALAWVFTIARHVAIDILRRRGREIATDGVVAIDPRPGPSVELSAKEELSLLLGRLTEDERELIRRRFLDDESYDAIASEQGMTEATVRQRLSRLLRKIQSGASRDS